MTLSAVVVFCLAVLLAAGVPVAYWVGIVDGHYEARGFKRRGWRQLLRNAELIPAEPHDGMVSVTVAPLPEPVAVELERRLRVLPGGRG